MNEVKTKKHNITVDYLKAAACICVVILHCMTYISEKNMRAFSAVTEISNIAGKISVPLFFIISGYLLHKQPLKKYFSKRMPKLAIPFFVFTAIKLLYSLFISHEFSHGDSILNQLFKAFIYGDLYWFSYAIILMSLLAPLFWNTKTVTRRNKTYELPVIAIILFFAILVFNTVTKQFNLVSFPHVFQIDRMISNIVFFLFGYIWRFVYPMIGKIKAGIKAILFVISLPVIVLARDTETLKYLTSTVVSFLLCMDLWFLVQPLKKIPAAISSVAKYTYQIFFLDSFVKIVLFVVFEKVLKAGLYNSLSLCLLVAVSEVILDVGISCVIAVIAAKIPIINVLFGESRA